MIQVSSFGNTSHPLRDQYILRTKKLIPFQWKDIPLKKQPQERPPKLLLEEQKFLKSHKGFVLLDEGGEQMTSKEFMRWILKSRDIHLVIGPSFGWHSAFKDQASGMLSLSKMTFTHITIQIMLAESIYRVGCELKNHPFVK